MYPSIFNRFAVIQPVSSKVRHFSTFFAHFGLPRYDPGSGTIAVNVTWMERGFNAGQTHRSMYPIYLQPFTSYSEILVGNCNFSLPFCIYNTPVGVFPLEFRKKRQSQGSSPDCSLLYIIRDDTSPGSVTDTDTEYRGISKYRYRYRKKKTRIMGLPAVKTVLR